MTGGVFVIFPAAKMSVASTRVTGLTIYSSMAAGHRVEEKDTYSLEKKTPSISMQAHADLQSIDACK